MKLAKDEISILDILLDYKLVNCLSIKLFSCGLLQLAWAQYSSI